MRMVLIALLLAGCQNDPTRVCLLMCQQVVVQHTNKVTVGIKPARKQ